MVASQSKMTGAFLFVRVDQHEVGVIEIHNLSAVSYETHGIVVKSVGDPSVGGILSRHFEMYHTSL